MHTQQKAAWFLLIVSGGTLVLYGAAVPALSWWFHRTMVEVAAGPALGVFGLVGLTGFGRLFYRRGASQRNKPVVTMDERDRLLSRRAATAGMRIFWLTFCIAAIGIWAYLYYLRGLERVTAPVGIFPAMLMVGYGVSMLSQALATLHFYGWTVNDADR